MLERFIYITKTYPLDVITHFFILIPLLVGMVRFPYLTRAMKLVLLFFFIDFCIETIQLFDVLKKRSTLYVPDVRASLNTGLVTGIYYAALVRLSQKKIIVGVGVIFVLFSIAVYSGDTVTPWAQTAFRVFAMGAALAYYNAILSDLNLKKIQHHSMFWFTAGLLFYAGGTFFTMLFREYLYDQTTPDAVFDRYYNLTQILYIVFCLFGTVGFWVSKQDKNNQFERDYFKGNFLENS